MYIVFTDLDGTLLDHQSYSYGESLPGIELLRKKGYPLVLVSSKTFDEMKLLHHDLELESPIIFENGGGVAYLDKITADFQISYLGVRASELLGHVDELSTIIQSTIKPITAMTIEEITLFTGLSEERSILAQKRMASLPFIIKEKTNFSLDQMGEFNSILNKKGLNMTKGGRFYHLLSVNANKGNAIKEVLATQNTIGSEPPVSVGIGDSENDIPMLQAVDIPYLVRKKDGNYIEIPVIGIKVTDSIGPAGFTEAMKDICEKRNNEV